MADDFQVIGQRQTIAQLEDGSYGPVMQITFRTKLGVVTLVNVPANVYTADKARAMIAAHAAEVDAVQNL